MSDKYSVSIDHNSDYRGILKDRMIEKRYLPTQLAREIGISPSRMTAYFKDGSKIPLPTFLKMCEVLEIKITATYE